MQVHEEQKDGEQGQVARMLGSVEVENKLLEDAIAEGLARLGITRDEATIEVIEEAKGGFLGIGAKNAKVRVSRINQAENVIKDILINLLTALDEKASVAEIKEQDGRYHCEIQCENIALLLGRRGRTIDAIQSLLSTIASKKLENHVRVQLDSGGFREKRKEVLIQMAQDAARDAVELHEEIHLEAMSSHDRKIIHACLSENPDVKTESDDTGDRRHIVVMPSAPGAKKAPSRPSDDRNRGGRSARGGRSDGRTPRGGNERGGRSSSGGGRGGRSSGRGRGRGGRRPEGGAETSPAVPVETNRDAGDAESKD